MSTLGGNIYGVDNIGSLTTVVLVKITLNIVNDRIIDDTIMGIRKELRSCCRHGKLAARRVGM